jgi:GT2 family glycosyltransferase
MTCPNDSVTPETLEQPRSGGIIPDTAGCDGQSDVSFVIPAWNHYGLLMRCLESIDRSAERCREIIVVDNGSDEAECGMLLHDPIWKNRIREHGIVSPEPRSLTVKEDGQSDCFGSEYALHMIRLPENTGFSHAVNIGIRHAKGSLIVLLNNDIVLDPGFAGAVRKAMDSHPEWIHAATKIRQHQRPDLLDDAGDALLPTGRAVKIGYSERDAGQYGSGHRAFSACGAAAVYRKSFFEKVGLFDDDFFAYLEDVDIGFRAQRMGYPCGWIPEAVSLHIGSATTGSMKNSFTVRLLAQNQVCMLVKNMPASLCLLLGIPIVFSMTAMWMKYLLQRKGNGKAYLEGAVSGIRLIHVMRSKRRDAKAAWEQSSMDLLRQLRAGGRLYRKSKAMRAPV